MTLISAVYLRRSPTQPDSKVEKLTELGQGEVNYQKFLGQLKQLRSTGNNTWRAFCPAHDSNSHSLALAVADDGRLLIKCHAGCGALDVLEAVGCSWSDCFPEDLKHLRSLAREFDIRPRNDENDDDRIVELAAVQRSMTAEDIAIAEAAALRGGRADGFRWEVLKNLPENKEWAEQLLEAERDLLRAEMRAAQ